MGSCLSKKKDSSSSSSVAVDAALTLPVSSKTVPVDVDPVKSDEDNDTQGVEAVVQAQKQEPRKREEGKEKGEEGLLVKKEMVKHRKSHERRSTTTTPPPPQQNEPPAAAAAAAVVVEEEMGNGMVRTSSCTKEEVDAILIKCGRLSRSNSSGKTVASSGRKYSGSKRSHDFDHNDVDREGGGVSGGGEDDSDLKKKVSDDDDEKRQHRQRHRQPSSRHSSSPSQGRRRRTPSREREREQRSGSKERGNGGGNNTSSGRRVSRSPGRRSENNNTTTNNGACNRPGKMVSVPATVTSLAMDKSNNSELPSNANGGVKRISVKRNAGGGDQAFGGVAAAGSRTAASPRSQSPSRANQQQPSLSRSSSRKAEHSPYRRNPLSEIDPNSLAYPQSAANSKANRVQNKTREIEADAITVKEFSTNILHQAPIQKPEIVALQKPQPVARSRSSRLSRDLDINPETLMNSSPLYNALLLEHIQSFHQKNSNTTPPPSISLPACVSKACSILEAVADLNSSSTTSSNLSAAFSEDRKGFPADHSKKKKMPESNCRDPFVESEVVGSDDLTEPSFHKYVTVRRGGGVDDLDDQESSGSNSIVGGSQQKKNLSFSSSSWEPNSADSTDRWTSRSSSSSHTRDQSPLGRTKREDSSNYEKVGIGRSRVGAGSKGGGLHTVPAIGGTAST